MSWLEAQYAGFLVRTDGKCARGDAISLGFSRREKGDPVRQEEVAGGREKKNKRRRKRLTHVFEVDDRYLALADQGVARLRGCNRHSRGATHFVP